MSQVNFVGGKVTVSSVTTGTVSISPMYVVGATTIAATGTGFLVIGKQSGATTGRALILSTTGGLIIDSMPAVGGGQQYSAANTDMGATATGSMIIGLQSGATTGRALVVTTTGGLVIGAMPAVGGGQQYTVAATDMGATATGTVLLGVVATTARAILINTTGGIGYLDTVGNISTGTITISSGGLGIVATVSTVGSVLAMPILTVGTVSNILTLGTVSTVLAMPVLVVTASANPLIVSTVSTILAMPVLSASNVTIASITTGTVTLANPVKMYVDGTDIGQTGTGIVIMGIQSGALSGRGLICHTTGQLLTIVSTVLAMPVLSATNITVASITTGTVNVINVLSATGVTLAATTAKVGAFVWTAHASNWSNYVIATTATNNILMTSGAHTLYVTDMLFSVDVPMNITWYSSAATAKGIVYLATKGGFVISLRTPLALNSAQSLTFTPSASGSCAGFAAGYTVT